MRVWIIGIGLLLAACGGGGGSPPSSQEKLQMFAGTWGPAAFVDGVGTQANFYWIVDMAFDAQGNLLVIDGRTRQVTPAAQVSTLSELPITSIAIDGNGEAYVAGWQGGICRLGTCYSGASIKRMAASGAVTDLVGVPSVGRLVAVNGDLYWTEPDSHVVRKRTADGAVTTVAGIEGSRGLDDGPTGIARLSFPYALAIDRLGNLFVTDSGNTIRRIAPDGTVSTIAGTPGAVGAADGIGPAARFNNPIDLAVDALNNIYVADSGNCTVRRITTAGVVTTVAGTAGACAAFVGGALPGALNGAHSVAIKGNDLYIGMEHGIAVVRDVP